MLQRLMLQKELLSINAENRKYYKNKIKIQQKKEIYKEQLHSQGNIKGTAWAWIIELIYGSSFTISCSILL